MRQSFCTKFCPFVYKTTTQICAALCCIYLAYAKLTETQTSGTNTAQIYAVSGKTEIPQLFWPFFERNRFLAWNFPRSYTHETSWVAFDSRKLLYQLSTTLGGVGATWRSYIEVGNDVHVRSISVYAWLHLTHQSSVFAEPRHSWFVTCSVYEMRMHLL